MDIVDRLRRYRPTYGWPEETYVIVEPTLNHVAADEIEQLRKYVQVLETGLKLANRNANHWEDALVELATSTFHSVEDYKERALEALKVNNYPN